jgi:hypothetical protein
VFLLRVCACGNEVAGEVDHVGAHLSTVFDEDEFVDDGDGGLDVFEVGGAHVFGHSCE